ncbi:hypothetical protein [Nonomuraea sp. LPB2021202275-12-8]|uniref:hypothetical protein n=1 Tax=Nonomuraea sp. LPB2021202275-12-8 TaxID=3120159 RepID=UPI00300CEC51
MTNATAVSDATYRPAWALRRPGDRLEPYYATETAAYARSRELNCETVTVLHRDGDTWAERETMWARCDGEPQGYDHTRCWEEMPPQIWTLRYEGGRGIDEYTHPSAAEALAACAIEAREGWHQRKELGRDDLPTEPPADDARAILIFHTALGVLFSLDAADAIAQAAR